MPNDGRWNHTTEHSAFSWSAATQSQNEIDCVSCVNANIEKSMIVLKVLSSKKEPLLTCWNSLDVLNSLLERADEHMS